MISKDIMYDLTRETARLLNKSQQQLKNIKWNDNEANLDELFRISMIVVVMHGIINI